MRKRLLTVEDLVNFCESHKFYEFSSQKSGYKLSVQIPAIFEINEETDDSHRGMMRVKIKIFHTGLNRNRSYISEDSAVKAMETIKNRPILAAIHQLDDGSWDFESHNFETVKNSDGENEIVYIEKQVGSFSEEDPFFEYDEEHQKNFVCAYAWIPEEYTKTAEILRRKNGSKNSCELTIEEMSYNAKNKYLELISFYVEGSTFLGSHKDGTEIGEGMLGSRVDIADFSVDNNSNIAHGYEQQLLETLNKINTTLLNIGSDNTNIDQEGGEKILSKFTELLEKYNISAEDVTFNYEGLSDEDLESKFEEMFSEEKTLDVPKAFQKIFEISHEDIRAALYHLLEPYEEEDNEFYYIIGVYDNYFAYENWNGGRIYGQGYLKDNDVVSFEGERYALHKEFLTDAEYAELQAMRENYSIIKSELENYQRQEEKAKKDSLFDLNDYKAISNQEDFKTLKETHDSMSFEDLEKKLDEMLLSFAKSGVALHEEKSENTISEKNNKVNKKTFNVPSSKNKKSRYGSLFNKK